MLNLNCWNLWTESSLLEAGTVQNMAYLDAVKLSLG